MPMFAATNSQLRVRHGHEHHRVTYVELFFDLVFVFAVTQLSHGLLKHLTPLGALQTGLLMIAVWWAWIDTTWITNWLDPRRPAVRMLLFALMLAGLVMSSSIPRAFEDRAWPLALAYVGMQVTRNLFMLWCLRLHDAANHRNFLRITIWHAAAAPFWLLGCVVDDPIPRLALWTAAVGIESTAPIVGFHVPGLGRSTTADWMVEGAHMAERCALFVIIALGESILIIGASFADLAWNGKAIAAFVVSFAGSVAMWTVYFNIGAERSSKMIASSADPGALARSGYTYFHILIIAGIIVVAVADEIVLRHPDGHDGHTDAAAALTILGGPALYLVGNMLFKRLSAPNMPLSHMVGLVLLVALVPAVAITTPLALSAGTTAILIAVAVWEWLSLRETDNAAAAPH
jgi:low temperature requirement protein LtrA